MNFKKGEIAILVNAYMYDGKECEIVSDLYVYKDPISALFNDPNEPGYDVMIEGCKSKGKDSVNGEFFVRLHQLRKKQPPQELGSWEALKDIWQPNKDTINV